MSRYNLIDEKWIPVRFPDGRREELSIRDALLRSKEISTIEDSSPLVVAALHRFLLAVLYRAIEGPTDIDQAKALFREGLPGQKIVAYLEKWRDRFWLFDETYPFGQNPNVPRDETEPWTKLTAEYNATSNKVLFDHTNTKNPGAKEPKECTRWLLSTMSFSIAGGRGYYPSPSPNAMMCLPLGRNLHETLCYNLVPYPNRGVMRDDSALWEREPKKLPFSAPKQTASGYADLYSWQSRMILLEELPSGHVSVVRFVAGLGFDSSSHTLDPMQPYEIKKTKRRMPVQFGENRATWREFDSLLPDSADLAPLTIQHSTRLANRKSDHLPKSLLVLGLRYEPPSANVDFWRMERFSLPEVLSSERNFRREIKALLTEADESQQVLEAACNLFARHLLRHGETKPDDKAIKALTQGFVKQMPLSSWYWSTLETQFHEMLRAYTLELDPDDVRRHWLISIRNALKNAWDQHAASISMSDAWAVRALVKAEGPIFRKLSELNGEIVKLEKQEVGP